MKQEPIDFITSVLGDLKQKFTDRYGIDGVVVTFRRDKKSMENDATHAIFTFKVYAPRYSKAEQEQKTQEGEMGDVEGIQDGVPGDLGGEGKEV